MQVKVLLDPEGQDMTRLELNDDVISAITKLSRGNPGAMTACMKMAEASKSEPMREFSVLLNLDTFEVYDSRIWLLYKDVCQQDPVLASFLLRQVQMGKLDMKTLNFAIDNRGSGLDIDALRLRSTSIDTEVRAINGRRLLQ